MLYICYLFLGLFSLFLGYESCAKWIHIFVNFVTFFGILFIRMKFSTFFGFFFKCVSRIPSVRILKKGEFKKKEGGRRNCIAQEVWSFFQCKNPLYFNMTANMGYQKWEGTWTTIRKGAIFKIRSHVWSNFTMMEKKFSKIIFKWWRSQFNYKISSQDHRKPRISSSRINDWPALMIDQL